jgi:hypothetical protein
MNAEAAANPDLNEVATPDFGKFPYKISEADDL